MNNYALPDMASVSDFQRNYAALIAKSQKSSMPLLVLKKNKLEAVLLNPALYEKLIEKVRKYEEIQAMEAISLYKKEKKEHTLKKMKSVDELFQ